MEYKIVTSESSSELTNKVNELIGDGWKPVGSHNVVMKNSFNRFSGNVHRDTIVSNEYSQTMIKE